MVPDNNADHAVPPTVHLPLCGHGAEERGQDEQGRAGDEGLAG